MWGYTLKAQLENKSTEKTYMFSVESASINGVQCDPMFASEVAAGKKANEEINFSTDTLEENGIVEYADCRHRWSSNPKEQRRRNCCRSILSVGRTAGNCKLR